MPSLHCPRLRLARSPGQQAAVWPALGHGHPSRFLSSGHWGVPPGGGGGIAPPPPSDPPSGNGNVPSPPAPASPEPFELPEPHAAAMSPIAATVATHATSLLVGASLPMPLPPGRVA